MAHLGKTELIVNAGTKRSKRGPYHQRKEGGFARIYRKAPDALREMGPRTPKTRTKKNRLRKEITVRTFGATRATRPKMQTKRTAKWTAKK